jgi:DnaK suppressor protein
VRLAKGLNYEYFERKLKKVREAVLQEINDLEPKVGENPLESGEETTPFPTHIADIADVESRLDRDSYLISQYSKELKDIDAAHRKIVEKTYGICEDCGSNIGNERLKAIPYARYCKSCAESREKKSWRKEKL